MQLSLKQCTSFLKQYNLILTEQFHQFLYSFTFFDLFYKEKIFFIFVFSLYNFFCHHLSLTLYRNHRDIVGGKLAAFDDVVAFQRMVEEKSLRLDVAVP